ncbi:MAG: STAS domain-containing protein [Oleibacter sp.]|nr:STAS domain-containing protein [Thalassolituus sp.]
MSSNEFNTPTFTANDVGGRLQGDLTLQTVGDLVEKGARSIQKATGSNEWCLDLGGVERFSSAGVALILTWLRRCEAANVSMKLVQPPKDLNAIVELCGLNEVFAPLLASES